jgi:hypothetical protein
MEVDILVGFLHVILFVISSNFGFFYLTVCCIMSYIWVPRPLFIRQQFFPFYGSNYTNYRHKTVVGTNRTTEWEQQYSI